MMSTALNPDTASRYRWYVLLLLTLAHTCHVMDRMVVSIVMEPIRHEFGLSDTQLGLISSLGYGVAYGIFVIPMGLLIDRVVRTRLLAIILATWSALTLVCGFATSWVALLISRCVVGVAESGGSPAGLSLLSDYFPPRERSTAVGLWYLASAFGTVAIFLGGGLVVAQWGWRYAFFMAGVPGVLLAILVLTTLREPVRGAADPARSDGSPVAAEKNQGGPGFLASLREVGARPAAVHLLLGVLLTAAAISSYSTWSVSFLVRQHDMKIAQAGLTVALTLGVVGALGSALMGVVADKASHRDPASNPWRSAAVAAITASLSTFLGIGSLLAESTVTALALVAAYAFVFTAYNGPANGLLLIVTPAKVRGFTIALLQLGATLIGYGVAPFVVGRLSDHIGGDNSLGYALAIMLLCHPWAALHFALAARHVRRSGTEAPVAPLAPAQA